MNLSEEVVGADDGWTAEENAALQLLLSDFPEKDADGKRVRALCAVLQPSLYIAASKVILRAPHIPDTEAAPTLDKPTHHMPWPELAATPPLPPSRT